MASSSAFSMETLMRAVDAINALRPSKPDFSHIVPSIYMTEPYDDWSMVRSKARGRRRLRKGYRQNVVKRERPRREVIVINGIAYAHPATLSALKHEINMRGSNG